MQVSHYRFGISWPRILPNGKGSTPNRKGIQYYKNVIRTLKLAGIEPVVTLFHWNTPQALEDEGGWLNPDIIDAFYNYSKICFEEFGNDVSEYDCFSAFIPKFEYYEICMYYSIVHIYEVMVEGV